MRQVRLSASAKADFSEAFVWYEGEQPGLGEEFRRAVEARLGIIARNPESSAAIDERLRRAPIRRFPYIVVFESDDQRVLVHALFHTSRNPARLHRRLRGA